MHAAVMLATADDVDAAVVTAAVTDAADAIDSVHEHDVLREHACAPCTCTCTCTCPYDIPTPSIHVIRVHACVRVMRVQEHSIQQACSYISSVHHAHIHVMRVHACIQHVHTCCCC